MAYLKPQSPLQDKDGDYIYPLTTADQIIMKDGSRFNNIIELESKAGFIYPLASANIPKGFLLCNGAEYGREEYPELFAAIGTMYGVGDGSTTFNVPNLATRVPVGAGEGYELGNVGGEATHTLTVAEMPKHDHKVDITIANTGGYGLNVTAAYADRIMVANGGTTPTQLAGSTKAHNNMQPYTVVNYIIATGKNTGVSVADIVTGVQALPLGVEYGGTGATNAVDARKNLGAMNMELLWQNGKPNDAFGRQNINVPAGEYDLIYIESTATGFGIARSGVELVLGYASYTANVCRVTGIYDSYIEFDDCKMYKFDTGLQTVNTDAIPYRIYGIKGVSV